MMRSKTRDLQPDSGSQAELPAEITSIQRQKKRKDRYSIYHKEWFITGVSVSTLMKFHLAKGVVITSRLLSEIETEEESQAVKTYMLRLLSRRDQSKNELSRKAVKKGYRKTLIDSILSELESQKYVNDTEFARKYTSDKMRLNKWGPRKIRSELYRKGISKPAAEQVIAEVSENLELNHICVDLILKRKQHFLREDEEKRKQKIIAYLQQKGFNFNTINRSLPEIFRKLHV